jgi:hypothetical protein
MSAMLWFAEHGADVFVPLTHCRDFDFIAYWGEGLARVQVKTSGCFIRDRWDITLCTRGGNRSWSGLVKYLDPAGYDYLFVLVGDGRRWLIPSSEVEARCGMQLGGPKYARFEIEPGRPLSATPRR